MAVRLQWPLIARVFLMVCVAFSAPPLLRSLLAPAAHNKDYDLWLETGLRVLRGDGLYPHAAGEGLRYMYPPFAAVAFMAPLAWGGPRLVVGAVVLLNAVAWAACVTFSVRLLRGGLAGTRPVLFVLPALVTAPYVWDNFLLGQPNVVLLAVMLGGMNLLASGRPALAGSCFALAAAVKAFPVMMLPYLLYRRRWKASVALVVVLGVLLFLVPAPVRGFDRNASEVCEWASCMLQPSGDRLGAGGAAMGWGNQSVFGLVHRLTRPLDLKGLSPNHPFRVNVAHLDPWQAQAIVGLLGVCAAAWFLHRTRGGIAADRRAAAAEASAVLVLLVLFSPVSRTYMFCWVMPAVAAWTALALDRGVPAALRGPVIVGGLASLSLLALALTQAVTAVPQALGVTTLGAALLVAIILRPSRAGTLTEAAA